LQNGGNPNKNWTLTEVQRNGTHEIGHTIGMGDLPQNQPETMSLYCSGDPSTLELDDKVGVSFLYGGNIPDNRTLSGTLHFNWPININSDKTLTFNAGSNINFYNNASLTVNGTLTANGTSGNRITFTGATKGCWNGIQFNSSSYNCHVSYCNIRNAANGIFIDNSSPTIEECFIDDPNNYGIWIQGSSSWPTISQNYIEGSYACVMHYNGGNGNFTNNSFRNSTYGVYVLSGSPHYDYYNVGRNIFESSLTQDKVRISSGQPCFSAYQYFTIPVSASYKYIYSNSASTIFATNNYWSANPPSSTYFYGNVDRSSPLANPPSSPAAGPNWSLPKGTSGDFFVEYNEALKLFYDGKFEDAKENFKLLTEKYLDLEYSSYALNSYMLAVEQLKDIGYEKEYLNKIKQDESAHANTRFYALKWMLQIDLRNGTFENLKSLASEVVSGSVYDWEISLDLAMGLSYYKNDKQDAKGILDKLTERFPDSKSLESIDLIKSTIDNNSILYSSKYSEDSDKNKQVKTDKLIPKEFELFNNYPNPFNPSTTIKYTLPTESKVDVIIFDIIGREVKTLANGFNGIGYKEVVWDGKNNNGQQVSSGIYICRIKATSLEDLSVFEKSIKLLLMK
jgi:hypothetical protein